jgi:DNA-binding MarR family transcriptional regulator
MSRMNKPADASPVANIRAADLVSTTNNIVGATNYVKPEVSSCGGDNASGRELLSAQSTDEFVDALVELSAVVRDVLTRTAGVRDLSLTQVRLLRELRHQQPGMQEVARFLGVDKSSATGLVDRAERRGLVRRETDPHDGRGVRVVITALGEELVRDHEAEARDILALLAEPLSVTQCADLVAAARLIVDATATPGGSDSPG